jgi:pyruvate,water dikinase
MTTYTIALADPKATLGTVGGKGLSLARMIQAGFPIPDGFHITTEAYRQFVAANELQPKILAVLREVDTALPVTLETASATLHHSLCRRVHPRRNSRCRPYCIRDI